MKSILKRLMYYFNIKISFLSDNERFIYKNKFVRKFVIPNTMLPSCRLVNLLNIINKIEKKNINGSIVECGVWKGGAIALCALKLKSLSSFRDLHLFDSFTDIVQPDWRVDGKRAIDEVGGKENAMGLLQETNLYKDLNIGHGNSNDIKRVLVNLINYPKNNVHIHQGFFQDTIPNTQMNDIAVLRLDGDWYESTKVCINSLFKYVVRGGYIIVDDYGAYDGCQKAIDDFIESNNIKCTLNSVDSDCVYFVKE
jgi:O-methyltransferase